MQGKGRWWKVSVWVRERGRVAYFTEECFRCSLRVRDDTKLPHKAEFVTEFELSGSADMCIVQPMIPQLKSNGEPLLQTSASMEYFALIQAQGTKRNDAMEARLRINF